MRTVTYFYLQNLSKERVKNIIAKLERFCNDAGETCIVKKIYIYFLSHILYGGLFKKEKKELN